jgi:glycosyltransferase involved in cell wall biosynthesis
LENSDRHPLFGIDPVRCHRPFTSQELTPAAREQARKRLGLPRDRQVVVSFGTVTLAKGVIECLHAFEQIRYWGAAPHLFFVGGIDPVIRPLLLETVAGLSLLDLVHFHEEMCSEQTCRDFLIAADCGIQLQIQDPGAFSGAYLDCISAGLPTLSNLDLAEAMHAPSFVATIPDQLSPLLIAEKVMALLAQSATGTERAENAAEHGLTNYTPQILKLLLAS